MKNPSSAAEPNKAFLTGSGCGQAKQPKRSGKFNVFKEQVSIELARLGVSVHISELCVIDLRHQVTQGFHNKLSPERVAQGMLDEVTKRYSTDGKWHYSRS